MTSFTMLLVRKYPVLLEGTISCSHHKLWPMVYYFSFYILVVCFLLNVFVAFILAVFNEVESVQRVDDEYRKQINTEKRARKARKARRSQGRNEQLREEGQHGTTRYSRVSSMDSVVSASSIGSIGSIGSISSFGGAHEPLQSRSDSQDAKLLNLFLGHLININSVSSTVTAPPTDHSIVSVTFDNDG